MKSSDRPIPTRSALALKWVVSYTDFLTSVLGLRTLLTRGYPHGVMQSVLTEKVRTVTELADQFNSLGLCPTLGFAGDEQTLWYAAVQHAAADCGETLASAAPLAERLASLGACQRSWEAFCGVVRDLPAAFGEALPVLNPHGLQPHRLAQLFQPRVRPTADDYPADELVREDVDQAILR